MIKRLIIAGLALSLLVSCGLVAFMASLGVEAWRPRIIAEAEKASGRRVTIGALSWQGWLSPTITLQDATLGNLPGGSRPIMMHVPRAEMRLSLAALLWGRIQVERLVLDGPDVLLETIDGKPNWAFGEGESTGRGTDVAIGELLVQGGRIVFPGGPLGGVELLRLSVDGSGDLRSEGEFRWSDALLRFHASGGPLARMMGGAGGLMPLSARFEMDGAQLTLQGTLREPRGLQGYALEAAGQANARALRRIAALTGSSGPIPETVSFQVRIAGSGWGWPSEQAVRFEMGEVTLAPGIVLSRTTLESEGAQAPLRVSVAGTRLADPFTLDGSLGPWRPAAPVPLDLSGTLLGHRLRLAGTVAEPRAGQGITLQVGLESPILGRLRATITERGAFFANGIELSAIRAEGATTQDGRLTVSRHELSGQLALGLLDLDALLHTAPVRQPTATPQRRSPRLIPDDPIDMSALLALPVDLDLAVATVRYAGTEYRDLAGRIVVEGQRARLDPIQLRLPEGRVTIRAAMQQATGGTQLQLALRGDGLPMAQLLREPPLSGLAELDVDLRGQGETWRALAASLVGHVGFAVLNGQVDNRLVHGAMPSGVGTQAPRIDVACLAARFDLVAGIAQARTLYADTSLGRLNGGGRVNLRDETLDLRLNTDLRLPLLNAVGVRVRAPVPISGMLAAPQIETGAMLSGGAAGTVAGLVPGLNQALGVQGMPDCGPPLTVARGGRSGPVPRSLMPAEPAPVQNLLRGLGVR